MPVSGCVGDVDVVPCSVQLAFIRSTSRMIFPAALKHYLSPGRERYVQHHCLQCEPGGSTKIFREPLHFEQSKHLSCKGKTLKNVFCAFGGCQKSCFRIRGSFKPKCLSACSAMCTHLDTDEHILCLQQ